MYFYFFFANYTYILLVVWYFRYNSECVKFIIREHSSITLYENDQFIIRNTILNGKISVTNNFRPFDVSGEGQ